MEIIKNLKDITNILSGAIDLLRLNRIPESSFHVLLFFLILKKENLLPIAKNKSIEGLEKEFNLLKFKNSELKSLYDLVYHKIIFTQLGSPVLENLLEIFDSIDLEIDDSNFQNLFDFLMYRYHELTRLKSGNYEIPLELAKFMLEIIENTEDSTLYNPFSGLGTFVVDSNYNSVLGHEPDLAKWATSILRGIAYKKSDVKIVNSNPINNWPETVVDILISAPPFGHIRNFADTFHTRYKSPDLMVVEKGLEILKTNGKMVVLVPNSFLFQSGLATTLRRNLVDSNFIEKIISLPSGVFSNSGVKSSVLVLNKMKSEKERNRIIMVKGEDFVSRRTRTTEINYDLIVELIKGKNEHSAIKYINLEEIDRNEFNLEIERYFWKAEVNYKELDDLFELKEILERISFRNTNVVKGKKLKSISIKHLQNDNLDYILKEFEEKDVNKELKNYGLIKESCIMVAKIGTNLKPTYFEYTGEPLLVSKNIMCFKINESKIDLSYLFNELHSNFVEKQLGFYRKGAAQVMLPLKSFLEVKIKIPSIAKQRLKIENLKEAYIKSKEKELKLQKEILGLKDEAFREFASIKHTFRQYLNALKSNVSGTRKFISRNEGNSISLNTLYSKNLNRTLGEHLLSLEGTIDSMSRLISEGKLDKGEAEILNPKELIEESQNRFKNPDVFKFEEIFFDHSVFASEEGYLNPFIKISKDGFFRIFSNIVYNAVEHGFRDRTGNIIRTAVSFDEENRLVLLEISNNGKPIPDEFTQQHLTTRGEKTTDSLGTGAGGADIKEILQKYNAQFELKKDETSEYPVSYILKFPLYTLVDKLGLDDFELGDLNI